MPRQAGCFISSSTVRGAWSDRSQSKSPPAPTALMARSAAKTMAMRVQVIGSAPGTAIAGEPPPVDQHVLARAIDGRLLVIELRLDGAVVGGLHGEQAAAAFGRETHSLGGRSEELSGGKEGVGNGRYRWA